MTEQKTTPVGQLGDLLERLLKELPVGHPDHAHLRRVFQHNALYAASSARNLSLHRYERKNHIARTMQEVNRANEHILGVVVDATGVSIEDILGKSRHKDFVRARYIASYLFSGAGNLGPVEIGKRLGGRDHSTIINHLDQVHKLIQEDAIFSETVIQAETLLKDRIAIVPTQGGIIGQGFK